MMQILLAERSSFSSRGIEALNRIAPVEARDLSQDELAEAVQEFEILVLRLGLHVDTTTLAGGERLRIIGTPTTGLDHIDLAAAEKRGVTVLSLKGERAFLDQVYATAEHTFALLLSLVRRIPAAFEAVKGHTWRRDLYRGREINGMVLGIIGCGRLGTMTARYGAGFGMQVLAYDPYQMVLPPGVERCDTLEELLERSQVLSLHVPLNAETEGMIGAVQLARLQSGALLVNTARGAVIDEAALLEALESGHLAGAALDVLCNEQQVGAGQPNPLIEYARTNDNLVITPHIGGATHESVEKADLFLAEKIKRHLSHSLVYKGM